MTQCITCSLTFSSPSTASLLGVPPTGISSKGELIEGWDFVEYDKMVDPASQHTLRDALAVLLALFDHCDNQVGAWGVSERRLIWHICFHVLF